MGSSRHILTSTRSSSKTAIGKRRGTLVESGVNPTAKKKGGLTMCWWRGGRLSRPLFNWKVLPRALVSKAARQGLHFARLFLLSPLFFYCLNLFFCSSTSILLFHSSCTLYYAGGSGKIQGILYPENSEPAKRSRRVAWEAAVESSTTSEQLGFQVI